MIKKENQSQNKDLKPQIKFTEEFKGTRTLEDIIKEIIVKSLILRCIKEKTKKIPLIKKPYLYYTKQTKR